MKYRLFDNFNNGTINVAWGQHKGVGTNLLVTEAPATPNRWPDRQFGSSTRALRVRLDENDPYVAGGPRSELVGPKASGYWGNGDRIYIHAKIFFANNYVNDPASEIVFQVHYAAVGVPFILYSVDNILQITGKGFGDVNVNKTKGEWLTFELYQTYSDNAAGSTRVLMNGVTKVNATGITNMDVGEELYPNFGIYKPAWKFPLVEPISIVSNRELYYDQIKITLNV